MTGLKLFFPVAFSLTLAGFAPTFPGPVDAEALGSPETLSVGGFHASVGWQAGLGTPLSAKATGCAAGESGSALVDADAVPSGMDDRQRAGSEGPSSTEQPLPDACPDDDDELFWDEVYRQIAEKCNNKPKDNVILEIECDAVGDGDEYHFRARVECNGNT